MASRCLRSGLLFEIAYIRRQISSQLVRHGAGEVELSQLPHAVDHLHDTRAAELIETGFVEPLVEPGELAVVGDEDVLFGWNGGPADSFRQIGFDEGLALCNCESLGLGRSPFVYPTAVIPCTDARSGVRAASDALK